MDTKYSSLFGLRATIARRLNIPKITDFLAKPTGCQAIIGDAFASAMLIWHVEHHVISDKAAAGWTMACDEVAGRHKNRAIDDRNFLEPRAPTPVPTTGAKDPKFTICPFGRPSILLPLNHLQHLQRQQSSDHRRQPSGCV